MLFNGSKYFMSHDSQTYPIFPPDPWSHVVLVIPAYDILERKGQDNR